MAHVLHERKFVVPERLLVDLAGRAGHAAWREGKRGVSGVVNAGKTDKVIMAPKL